MSSFLFLVMLCSKTHDLPVKVVDAYDEAMRFIGTWSPRDRRAAILEHWAKLQSMPALGEFSHWKIVTLENGSPVKVEIVSINDAAESLLAATHVIDLGG